MDSDTSCGLSNRLFVAVSYISQFCQQRGCSEDYSLVKREPCSVEGTYQRSRRDVLSQFLVYVAVLKKQTVCFYDSLVTNYQSTRCHIPFTTIKNSSLL